MPLPLPDMGKTTLWSNQGLPNFNDIHTSVYPVKKQEKSTNALTRKSEPVSLVRSSRVYSEYGRICLLIANDKNI